MSAKPCSKHTPEPSGYLAWHEWAEKKAKTHDCERCPDCGLFKIWKRRVRVAEGSNQCPRCGESIPEWGSHSCSSRIAP